MASRAQPSERVLASLLLGDSRPVIGLAASRRAAGQTPATPAPSGSRAARPRASDGVRAVPYPARVIVVDPHDIPRAGIRGVLAGEPEFEVVTEAGDGHQAVALCRRLRPDLVLMELRLPGLDGIMATRQIRQECPDTRIVILTGQEEPGALRRAVEAGAAAFLVKTATRAEVLGALRRVLTGDLVLDQELAAQALHQLVEAPSWAGVSLTAREHEVLRLVALGKTNQQIGLALTVSTRTAKAHVERIIARLGAANRTEAVARAISLGMLAPPAVPTHTR
ncbi:MAG: response regulator transcription factor [Chloroflexi bacterium]|nr:response regulator transcription factor [Chloroflexota bacterium]